MYSATIEYFAETAAKKVKTLKKSPLAFLAGALMAGAYVGLGILLMISAAATMDPSMQKLVMGATFGIAITLVVFAGAELFTGHTMYMVFGWLAERTGLADMAKVWAAVWLGNLLGAIGLAVILVAGGGAVVLHSGAPLLFDIASHKIHSTAVELVARGILCNWLVCLSLWMSARTKSDAAKCIMIFWCLLAFIASGYEHSIANMTIFAVTFLADHPADLTVAGMAHNLLWVTIGNIIAGAVFMAGGYWLASAPSALPHPAAAPAAYPVKASD